MSPPASVIEASSVYKVFVGRDGEARMALRDVGLTVGRGEFVSLVGPSGCGKSTLLNMFAGLVAPSDGSVTARGPRRSSASTHASATCTQDDNLLPWRTVLGNVELALECKGVPRAERHARAADYLARVGLDGIENLYPHELSGGMRKRVSIVRTLDRRQRRRDPHGRAVRPARRANTPHPAGRTAAAVARQRPHHRLRHPRHRRGDRAQRPHRHLHRARRARSRRCATSRCRARATCSTSTKRRDFSEIYDRIWNDLRDEMMQARGRRCRLST